jgi:hypothetical protein
MNSEDNARGFVLYHGPSLLDGAPIMAVATLESKNDKTGNLIQSWIMRTDIEPHIAIQSGIDTSICGNCPLRGLYRDTPDGSRNYDRVCYVDVAKAPLGVWRGFHRGIYPTFDATNHRRFFVGRSFRAGSYGDPAAVPYDSFDPIYRIVRKRRTGYTHQFRTCDNRWRDKLMASAESENAYWEAKRLGWRVFRTKGTNDPYLPGEKVCPASEESGFRKQCKDCLQCSGAEYGKGDWVLNAHGSKPKMYAIERFFA